MLLLSCTGDCLPSSCIGISLHWNLAASKKTLSHTTKVSSKSERTCDQSFAGFHYNLRGGTVPDWRCSPNNIANEELRRSTTYPGTAHGLFCRKPEYAHPPDLPFKAYTVHSDRFKYVPSSADRASTWNLCTIAAY